MTRRVSDNIINSSFFSLKGCCPTTKSFFNHVYHYMTNLIEQITGEKMQYDFKQNNVAKKNHFISKDFKYASKEKTKHH